MSGKRIHAMLSFLTPRLSMTILAGWGLAAGQAAVAHPQLMTCVRHRTAIEVNRKNVDVTIELTLGEIPAFAERLLIDDNQDGAIAASEVKKYLAEQSDALQHAVTMSIAGQQVELLFLYEPEMDGESGHLSAASHLVIRLFYFARLPSGLKAGDAIVLEDRLWSHAPSLGSYHVVGQKGVDLIAENTASTRGSTANNPQPLIMRVRCLAATVDTADGTQRARGQQADPQAASVASQRTVSERVADQRVDRVDLRMEHPLQAPSSDKLPVGWLLGFGAIALIAGTAAVLTRRPY